jgi:hypothetical protein
VMQRNSSSLDALYGDVPFMTYTVESKSGAQSTRMHYRATVASALAMARVAFLNFSKS